MDPPWRTIIYEVGNTSREHFRKKEYLLDSHIRFLKVFLWNHTFMFNYCQLLPSFSQVTHTYRVEFRSYVDLIDFE